jgi:broad specificity phosphatase PhoE
MQAVLERHGETEQNAHGIFQGYSSVPLSARGRLQVARVAEPLVCLRPQGLYSSDLRRALETAAIISQQLGLPVQHCEGLSEWNIGTWIGQSTTVYLAHLQSVGAHPVTYVPAGGESQLHTQARIVAQMQALARQHAEDTIVCMSHGTAIDLLAQHILGLDVMRPPTFHIANTSVNIFPFQDGAWEVVTLNEVYHLESLVHFQAR